VVFLPPTGGHAGPPELDETIRQAHFVAIMEALQAVVDKPVPADAYSSAELDVLGATHGLLDAYRDSSPSFNDTLHGQG
jgi:hypothetical protein